MAKYRTGIALLLLPALALAVDLTFEIPPVPVSVEIAGQPVSIIVSGELSGTPEAPGVQDQSFSMNLRADLGDLQSRLTPMLQTELNRSDRCGERLTIFSATLAPARPAADLAVQLHFEKWICIRGLGDTPKKLLGGDATVHVILTPALENSDAGQTVRLDARIGGVDANGPLEAMLRSGAMGGTVRDKVRESILKAVQKSTDLDGVIPERTRRYLTLRSVAFADAGFGRPALDLTGRLRVPGEEVSSVLEQFGNR